MYKYRIKNILLVAAWHKRSRELLWITLSQQSAVIAEGHIYSAVVSRFLDKTGEVMSSFSYSTGFGFSWSI